MEAEALSNPFTQINIGQMVYFLHSDSQQFSLLHRHAWPYEHFQPCCHLLKFKLFLKELTRRKNRGQVKKYPIYAKLIINYNVQNISKWKKAKIKIFRWDPLEKYKFQKAPKTFGAKV